MAAMMPTGHIVCRKTQRDGAGPPSFGPRLDGTLLVCGRQPGSESGVTDSRRATALRNSSLRKGL